MRVFTTLVACLLLAGCASTPIDPASATQVTPDRLYAFRSPAPTYGQIVVTRDRGNVASQCLGGFYINGELAAKFAVGETATFHVPSGELLLKYTSDPEGRGWCSGSPNVAVQRESSLKPSEVKRFRLLMSPEGFKDIQRQD
jgi:hypothetical protein